MDKEKYRQGAAKRPFTTSYKLGRTHALIITVNADKVTRGG